ARHGGRVVFVRHALPGERVRARVTEGGASARFWRCDAVAVLEASEDRVQPPCPVARPGLCGGCDFQHVALEAQRRLKAEVVAEQLRRLAGLEREVVVEAVPGDVDGLRWRTRTAFAVDAAGRAGLRKHRSHEVVALADCPISTEAVVGTGVLGERWAHVEVLEVAAPSDGGDPLLVVTPAPGGPARLRLPRPAGTSVAVRTAGGGLERVSGRTWLAERVEAAGVEHRFRVSGAGFWQVHPGAGTALVEAVLAGLRPRPGERALDLYSGAGLFTAALAEAVGVTGTVVAVEQDARAVKDARRALHEHGQVRLVAARVDAALAAPGAPDAVPGEVDVVVLDPPRSGAGREVVERLVGLRPRAVAYVACDPAALARDVATFAGLGYRLEDLRAFDLFPMTHHVECVGVLVPVG
ncbi:class I SAM-dependent RNA methyltransferase, partial [Kineococcus glutinatus]|uniref:class I SAM-dependent RNA methyltransferase n=1 Tax=Kineococcus glutinatus TaxID=1070872 RepID=UPI0031F17656